MDNISMEEYKIDSNNSNNEGDPRAGYGCGLFCSNGGVCGTFCVNVGGANCGWICPGNGC